jgi:hypothetical protein
MVPPARSNFNLVAYAVATLGALSTSAIHVIAIEAGRPMAELVDVVAPLVLHGLRSVAAKEMVAS